MKKVICAIAVLTLLIAAGCGKPEDKYVGKWDGKVNMPPEMIAMIKSFAPADKQADFEKEIASTVIELELKKGGTYSLGTTTKGNTNSVTGKWTFDTEAKTVTIEVPEQPVGGKKDANMAGTPNTTMVAKVSDDGKTLTYSDTQMGMAVGITFTKK